MMFLMMHQPHLHQPWRLDRCNPFIHMPLFASCPARPARLRQQPGPLEDLSALACMCMSYALNAVFQNGDSCRCPMCGAGAMTLMGPALVPARQCAGIHMLGMMRGTLSSGLPWSACGIMNHQSSVGFEHHFQFFYGFHNGTALHCMLKPISASPGLIRPAPASVKVPVGPVLQSRCWAAAVTLHGMLYPHRRAGTRGM